MVPVSRNEIAKLKRGVQRAFSNPVESSFTWAAIWLGVAMTAGVSLAGLLGVKGNHVKTWVLDAHWIAVSCGTFLTLYCGYYGWRGRKGRKVNRDDLLADLDHLNERAPTTVAEPEPQAEAQPHEQVA
jgi:hypothetical protein